MGALSSAHADGIINDSLRSATNYLALFLTDPTAGDTGVEASGGNYARKTIAFGVPSTVGGKQQTVNTNLIDYGVMTADLGVIAYWGIYDAAAAGNLLWFGAFTLSKLVETSDRVEIAIGDVICNLS